MDKKLYRIVITFVIILFSVFYTIAGEHFVYNGLEYEVVSETDKTCKVVFCSTTTSGDVAIPTTANYYRVIEIANDAFVGCKKIESISIPWVVRKIGSMAFNGCSALSTVWFNAQQCADFEDGESPFGNSPIKNLIFGPTVHHLPNNIASQIYTLETVTIGTAVETIGDTPFADCTGIKTVNYNAINANYSGEFLFNECPIENINFGSEVKTIPKHLVGFSQTLESVIFPDKVDSIGYQAFYECRGIKTITIGASLKEYSGFFCSVENGQLGTTIEPPLLEHIYVSDENPYITAIDDVLYAKDMSTINYFPRYRKNEVYDVPSSLKSLGVLTFRGLYNLHVININHNVEIPFWDEKHKLLTPFDHCVSLEEINVNNHSQYTSMAGALYSKDKKILVCYPAGRTASSFTIPTSVEEILTYAVRFNESIKNIIIPDNVTIINDHAFAYDTSLISVIIGNGVTILPRNCFSGCKSLSSVTLPDELKIISSNAFSGCSSLSEISLPVSIKSIGSGAFRSTAIQSISLPDDLIAIGRNAFAFSQLREIAIPESVLYVGMNAFNDTPWYNSTNYITSNHVLIKLSTYSNDVTIPSGIKIIAGGALSNCSYMNTLTFPSEIESIGSNAINATCPWNNYLEDGLNYVGATLYKAKNISNNNIIVREGIKGIGGRAFNFNNNLINIILPKGIVTIGEDAFSGTGITSILIPEGTRYIGYDAFYACSNLKSVTLPSTVEVIDDFAFESVSTESPMTTFICNAKTPPLLTTSVFFYSGASGDIRDNCTLFVPNESISIYKATEGWKQFKSIMSIDAAFALGDLDGSGIIDVEDVNAVINIILKFNSMSDYPGNGDMDGNGIIDVEDVNAIINIILKL